MGIGYSKEQQLNRGGGLHSKDVLKYQKRSKTWLKNKAIEYFNKWIRERDRDGAFFTCCSCHKRKLIQIKNKKSNYHAGHFYPGTCESLRFDEVNVNGECSYCNFYSGDHLIGYAVTIVEKHGQKEKDRIDVISKLDKRSPKKWHRIELIEIILKYKS